MTQNYRKGNQIRSVCAAGKTSDKPHRVENSREKGKADNDTPRSRHKKKKKKRGWVVVGVGGGGGGGLVGGGGGGFSTNGVRERAEIGVVDRKSKIVT